MPLLVRLVLPQSSTANSESREGQCVHTHVSGQQSGVSNLITLIYDIFKYDTNIHTHNLTTYKIEGDRYITSTLSRNQK